MCVYLYLYIIGFILLQSQVDFQFDVTISNMYLTTSNALVSKSNIVAVSSDVSVDVLELVDTFVLVAAASPRASLRTFMIGENSRPSRPSESLAVSLLFVARCFASSLTVGVISLVVVVKRSVLGCA